MFGGDQDLGPSRSVDQHCRVVGVFVADTLTAVDHREVGHQIISSAPR